MFSFLLLLISFHLFISFCSSFMYFYILFSITLLCHSSFSLMFTHSLLSHLIPLCFYSCDLVSHISSPFFIICSFQSTPLSSLFSSFAFVRPQQPLSAHLLFFSVPSINNNFLFLVSCSNSSLTTTIQKFLVLLASFSLLLVVVAFLQPLQL